MNTPERSSNIKCLNIGINILYYHRYGIVSQVILNDYQRNVVN